MGTKIERRNNLLLAAPEGRLDAFEAEKMGKELESQLSEEIRYLVLDMTRVPYLSSGGIRVILAAHKKLASRNGGVSLCGLSEYPSQVLKMAGMDALFTAYPGTDEAIAGVLLADRIKQSEKEWHKLPCFNINGTSVRVFRASTRPACLKTVGSLMKVMKAVIDPVDIKQRRFSETEYSIGLGALGASAADCLPLLGEMMTCGGTMVWLPTDGHDTPDFLIPHKDTGEVVIQTAYNMALDGEFNDIMVIGEAPGSRPLYLSELYSTVFEIADGNNTENRCFISIAMSAELDALFSSGVKIAPIRQYSPRNNGLITEPENISAWMNVNKEPKFAGCTMVSFGIGLDLSSDYSSLPRTAFENVFYLHPANTGSSRTMLHNHAVVFKPLEWRNVLDLDSEIRRIVHQGEFLDMRHLLDTTRVRRAIAGVSYLTAIRPDRDQA